MGSSGACRCPLQDAHLDQVSWEPKANKIGLCPCEVLLVGWQAGVGTREPQKNRSGAALTPRQGPLQEGVWGESAGPPSGLWLVLVVHAFGGSVGLVFLAVEGVEPEPPTC